MAFPITSIKGGINRYLIKAGAKSDTLIDALNADVTLVGRAKPRYGTVLHSQQGDSSNFKLPPGTKGLTTYKEKLYVFSDAQVDMTDYPDFECEILTYPGASTLVDPPTLARINFAEPFLGYLYISATWSDGETFHYWLQAVTTWSPNTIYYFNQLVQPIVPNGFTYRARRLNPANREWTPNTAKGIGDIVEPTTPNSFMYVVEDTFGANPRTGPTEPVWNTTPGSITFDDADLVSNPEPPEAGSGSSSTPPQDVVDRYGSGTDAPTTRGGQIEP